MNERDKLGKLLFTLPVSDRAADTAPEIIVLCDEAAEAILDAGYRKPWTITTAAERAILQPGTICMDKDGNAWKRGTGSWVSTGGDTDPLYDEDDLELTVLHEGTQP